MNKLPCVLVVMGVSGSGKSTVGSLLAARLGWEYADADRFHSEANVAKMDAGIALTDADRWPWLEAIAAWIEEVRRDGRHGVVGCSALKRSYRDLLAGGRTDVRIVYLKGDEALIASRLAARHGHFMPPRLLRSQFETLEEPQPDEQTIAVEIAAPPQEIVARIVAALNA